MMHRSSFGLAGFGLFMIALAVRAESVPVRVAILEGVPDKRSWDFTSPIPTLEYAEPAFGLVVVPRKYSDKGQVIDRSNPFVLRAEGMVTLPAGDYRFLLRARNAARLWLDDQLILETKFLNPNGGAHEEVPDAPARMEKDLCQLSVGHQELLAQVRLDAGPHRFRLEGFVGGARLRPDVGVLLAGVARGSEPFRLLGPGEMPPLTEDGWSAYVRENQARHQQLDDLAYQQANANERRYWDRRHELARKIVSAKPAPAVPKVSERMPVHNVIDRFIGKKLADQQVAPAPLTDDLAFLRRVTLDTVGVAPTPAEIDAFLRDPPDQRRANAIDRLLADPRWADHWVSYWQDVLAENPGILKPMLNNTGPFRWYLHQALRHNLAMDRFATELILMEGSAMGGGPAGFALATENDVPMAAKAHVIGRAFLGVELACARCHDAPHHPYLQKDLFSLGAMLAQKPLTVPASSSIPAAELERRPLVEVTLRAGAKVSPAWPFTDLAPAELPPGVLRDAANPRERLAAILTSPHNDRFAQVLVNRLWKRYLGWGIVEPVDDWSVVEPSHPDLLAYLARELALHDYDMKHLARLVLNSHAYQRQARPDGSKETVAAERLFAAPARRRLSAEQLLDTLFVSVGKEFHSEELCFDPEGRRPANQMLNLGAPRRAWEFTSLSNERDRPALALPVAQTIVDLLVMYGWRDARQFPLTVREETPTPLQPLLLANGTVGSRITRLSDDSTITELCLEDRPLAELIDAVFLRILTRRPSVAERELFTELLADGYADRRLLDAPRNPLRRATQAMNVSWSNHLSPEATRLKLELERAVRQGDPPTQRLRQDWRERMEDMLWALVNAPEFMFVP